VEQQVTASELRRVTRSIPGVSGTRPPIKPGFIHQSLAFFVQTDDRYVLVGIFITKGASAKMRNSKNI
jgi:hypothetical protein